MKKILDEIGEERAYQERKWGSKFDDKNTRNDWVTYIVMYASAGARMDKGVEDFKEAMVKVAALAVAALQACERNGRFPPRHYD